MMSLCILGSFFVGVSPVAAALNAPIASLERQLLLTQIAFLQAEVARLQAILMTQRAEPISSASAVVSVYGTNFSVEQSYEVSPQGTLTPPMRSTTAQSLFSLWNGVIGTSTTIAKVSRWQIFHDSTTLIGAYVETQGVPGDWVISVNRAGYVATQRSEQQSFAELFVHEYAHMFFYEVPTVVSAFKDRFWTARDQAHSATIQNVSFGALEKMLARYYSQNQTRFVSDYATVNADEDMAETFLALVFGPAPADEVSTLAEKQQFLLADPTVAHAVYTIRQNLSRLGLE